MNLHVLKFPSANASIFEYLIIINRGVMCLMSIWRPIQQISALVIHFNFRIEY